MPLWRRSTWLFLIASFLIWLFLFRPFLVGQSCFGYRDTAHLYYPLFEWIQAQWSRGEIPLWNPLDDFGQPLVADGVSSVFYPLKAIFFLTALPYPVRFGFYVSLHALVAAWGAYFLARTLRLSRAASAMSASGFALSGAVLFQSSNVVYLIGAAWLPWALATGWSALRTAHPRDIAGCAAFIALMILGGDPQSAYHVLLILAASAIFAMLRPRQVRNGPTRFASVARFSLIATIAAGLSAVQWLPSWQWQQRSVRANPETPRSVWESTHGWANGRGFHADNWFCRPIGDTHHDHIYQFSQPPWSLIELVWPNVSGKEFPVFRRWTNAIPGADRVWTPSLYIGLVVILLAVSGARLWGRSKIAVGLTWLTIFFGLGSFGWYGMGWAAREFGAAFQLTGLDQLPASPFGVYWWMVTLLPGYALFRYPAKLFVVATLGASLLAGYQLTRMNGERLRIIRWLTAGVLTVSLALLGFTFWPGFSSLFSPIPADSTFGSFDVAGALSDLRITFLHASIVCGMTWFILRSRCDSPDTNRSSLGWIVALALVELVIANAWLVVGVPADAFKTQTASALVEKLPANQTRPRMRGIGLLDSQPAPWTTTTSAQRLQEVIRYERASLYPKFHLSQNVDLIGSFHAIEPLDLKWFNEYVGAQHDSAFAINYRIHPGTAPIAEVDGPSAPNDARRESLPASPRVICVNEWTPPSFSRDTRLHADQEHEIIAAIQADLPMLTQADAANSNRPDQAAGDIDSSLNRPAVGRSALTNDSAIASILRESANQIDLFLRCDTAGWLILKDYWDAGWQVDIHDRQSGARLTVQPERFCGIFRAVKLPNGGEFDVRFVYRPASLFWGSATSIATLLIIILALVARRISPYP